MGRILLPEKCIFISKIFNYFSANISAVPNANTRRSRNHYEKHEKNNPKIRFVRWKHFTTKSVDIFPRYIIMKKNNDNEEAPKQNDKINMAFITKNEPKLIRAQRINRTD